MTKPNAKRSPKWPALRRRHLKAHPSCKACGCAVKGELEAHHVKPFHLFPRSELRAENLVTLCERKGSSGCHMRLGHLGNWKKWNPLVRSQANKARAKLRKSQ